MARELGRGRECLSNALPPVGAPSMLCWAHHSHSWINCRLLCCGKFAQYRNIRPFQKKFKVSNTCALSLTPWKSVSVCVLYFDQCSPRTPRQKPGQLRAGSSGSRANRDKKRLNRTRLDIDRIIIINCCYLPVLCRIYLLQGPTNNDK